MRAQERTSSSAHQRRVLPGAVLLACLTGLALTLPGAAAAQGSLFSYGSSQNAEPLVLVVHGIGGGNRDDGWSNAFQQAWKIGQVKEITFRNDTHDKTSNTDAAYYAGDWALDVQRQIKTAAAENPGRPIVIISHSWGTVATSMALAGGSGGGKSRELTVAGNQVRAMNPDEVHVAQWITLGSPLGSNVLNTLRVEVSGVKPPQVDEWTNIYDVDDPVSRASHNLAGATNIEVSGSAGNILQRALDFFGTDAHTGIWTNPTVTRHIQTAVSKARSARVTSTTPTTRPPVGTPTIRTQPPVVRNAPPADGGITRQTAGATDYAVVCQSAVTAIERYYQKLYGAEFLRIEWKPAFHYENGDCVGGYILWAQRASDKQVWAPLDWNGDTGRGRISAKALIQQYAANNPDLPWSPGQGQATSRPSTASNQPNPATTCQSAMKAIERYFRNSYGGEFLRIDWTPPFRYENGFCVGGYTLWAQRSSDKQVWAPLSWNADTGNGRISLQQLIQEYANRNPDLPWVEAPR